MSKKIIAIFIFFLICAAVFSPPDSSAAEIPADSHLDIKEAIDITLRNNSGLRSIRQEAVKAEAFKVRADGTLLPAISMTGYIDDQRESQTTDGSDRTSARVARATLEQVLYSGGRNAAIRRQSQQVKSIADLMLIDGENSVVGELFARFYNLLLQQERVNTEEAAIRTSELHLREVVKRSELGLANRLEVIRAEQQLAANIANLATAQGLYESAHISLMNYMAIPPEQRRPVTGGLRIIEIEGTRENSLKQAMMYRADLLGLDEQYKYQKNQIAVERSGMLPRITLGASAGYLSPYRNQDRGDDTWRAELSITVPIFDRNVTRGSVMSARATLEQDRISLAQKELDVKSGVETAWTEYETTLRHLDSTERALELAKESLRLAGIGFQEGVTPQLDLLMAQNVLTEASLEHIRSLYNHLLAVVALKVTEGTIISWAEERVF